MYYPSFLPLSHSSSNLLSNDSPHTERLQPPEDSIVPKDMRSPPAVINTRFQMQHTQAHSRKIYIRDFAQHLQNMLDDSGYKFSEEYEVRACKPSSYPQIISQGSKSEILLFVCRRMPWVIQCRAECRLSIVHTYNVMGMGIGAGGGGA